jgi:organic radical activating enzyme
MTDVYRVEDGIVRATTCEINVVEHCNLSCRSCSHVSPVLPHRSVDADDVFRDLSVLGRHYHATTIKLLGGEPLLHRGLLDVIAAVRRAGIGDRVTVATNGVLLPRMEEDFWRAVDEVLVSVYPGQELDAVAMGRCRKLAGRHGVFLSIDRKDSFRESHSELGTSDARLVRRIYETCQIAHAWRCHTVADGYFYKCGPSYFLPKLLASSGERRRADGLAIEDSPGFGERLLALLNSPDPLLGCTNCLGTAGKRFPHVQVRRSEFRGHQQRTTEELVDTRYFGMWPRLRRRLRERAAPAVVTARRAVARARAITRSA